MDPTAIAAMVEAGSRLAVSLFEKWSGGGEEQKSREFVAEHYETLRGLTSDNCMRLLKRLEDGQNRSADELLHRLYPDFASYSRGEQERLRSEFDYRLFFMSLAGLVTRPTREFYITTAGKGFVNLARERHHYFKVLFDE